MGRTLHAVEGIQKLRETLRQQDLLELRVPMRPQDGGLADLRIGY